MEIETLHLFWECTYVQQFWMSLSDLLQQCNINIDMNIKTVSFGICQPNPNHNIRVQNFIIYVAKNFIFQNKQRKQAPNILHFKSYLISRIQIEKEIALLNDKLAFFELKWKT